ncbi:MAG TPA: sigma 54-interacting transcriptional regulator [Candidatus Limnocylindrales bacterium]|nr:sigma 54-interacting transcriptional regulator [Candidatus Limnocylindrales bacterium]
MEIDNEPPVERIDEQAALRMILEGTASETGERFFAALVRNLSKALNTTGAWVTEFLEAERKLRALAFWFDGAWIPDYVTDLRGTPCEQVIVSAELVHFPENLIELFPEDQDVKTLGAVSYLGMPLKDIDGRILGHLAVIDRRFLPNDPRILALFRIFADRASAELRRLRAEKQVDEREAKLRRLVGSAMDAIVEFDNQLSVTLLNPAAEQVFQRQSAAIGGEKISAFFSQESGDKLLSLVRALECQPKDRQSMWIAGGLTGCRKDRSEFPAEASLSRSELGENIFYTLILRNLTNRLEAERKILVLSAEAEQLRAEIQSLQGSGDIIGGSAALKNVLRDIEQVAETDATVLLLGETGTGKELVARAIHKASRRADKALITINCAAIPTTLMESEFFGHERGAFTGATQKREGRFALANGGTIFLDEIAELNLELQAKLLRILQEGEFEPVGSSQTRKVNVRVIAATNRDLGQAVRTGNFRDDLYYRLNVFPISLPALRERGDDVIELANLFANKFAQRSGRRVEPLTDTGKQRLKKYSWPGNVRELQNVIERAVITSQDGRLNLDRALPGVTEDQPTIGENRSSESQSAERILQVREIQQLERQNILRAMEKAGWRVAGSDGAAELLGINPSTLNSRIKALGIQRLR